MKKEDKVFISHIYESILYIEKFEKNIQLQDAVIRRLEIIGEATKNLTTEFRKKHSDIPWKFMTGTRDVISHKYFGIDFVMIWKIIKNELPGIKKQILKILEVWK